MCRESSEEQKQQVSRERERERESRDGGNSAFKSFKGQVEALPTLGTKAEKNESKYWHIYQEVGQLYTSNLQRTRHFVQSGSRT